MKSVEYNQLYNKVFFPFQPGKPARPPSWGSCTSSDYSCGRTTHYRNANPSSHYSRSACPRSSPSSSFSSATAWPLKKSPNPPSGSRFGLTHYPGVWPLALGRRHFANGRYTTHQITILPRPSWRMLRKRWASRIITCRVSWPSTVEFCQGNASLMVIELLSIWERAYRLVANAETVILVPSCSCEVSLIELKIRYP